MVDDGYAGLAVCPRIGVSSLTSKCSGGITHEGEYGGVGDADPGEGTFR